MQFKFAKRAATLKASEIRELLKLTEKPEIISFAGGLPAPELFPIDKITEIVQDILQNDAKAALQYSATEGFVLLREIIAKSKNGLGKCENYTRQCLDYCWVATRD
jgi:Transcriptional regulators containing a DNA-binding HTH domain and an aminotransferase domain (MocR family) and their eukaryotic orthologs